MNNLRTISDEIISLVKEWEPILISLSPEIITTRRNKQNRNIKQILGHLIDSSSNNTHRIIHLQYQTSPLIFPNYASFGNNDRWIAIQDYQHEDWSVMVNLWKFSTLHVSHVISCINTEKLDNEWISNPGEKLSLREMVNAFNSHLRLHLSEIEELMKQ